MRRALRFVFVLAFVPVVLGQTPAAVERELVGYAENITKYGTYAGAYNGDKLDGNNDALRNALIKYGKRSDILAYKFPRLAGKIYVATSPDGRLRIYSWDLENGGSMHDFDNVYQYRGKSGKVYTWSQKPDPDGGGGDFFHDMYQVDTAAGPVYLAVGTSIGDTSLNGQSISGLRIDGEKLDRNFKVFKTRSGPTDSIGFLYDFFTVVDHPERPVRLIRYDEAKKSFRFPVIIEDSKNPKGRVTNKFITYRFDGTYFVKVS